jgi:hypothetical protein
MFSIPQLRMRDALAIASRAQQEATLWDMAAGTWVPAPGDVGPPPRSDEASAAYQRLIRLVYPVGPQVVRTRLAGTISDVTWSDAGRGGKQLDQRLQQLDLYDLASGGFMQMFITGLTAYSVVRRGDEVTVARLGGYLEPLLDPDDVEVVTGLLQAWQTNDERRAGRPWRVRIYDYQDGVLREWVDLTDPEMAFSRPPTSETAVGYMPHIAIAYRGADGLPLSEMRQGVNLLRANYAIQLRIHRVAELHGYPVPVVVGQAEIPRDWGPGQVLAFPTGQGEFRYVFPEALTGLYELLRQNLESIREFFSLPGGSLGTQTPSGEALREANRKYVQICNYYARKLSTALSAAARDYARAIGADPVDVEVIPHDMGRSGEVLSQVVNLYREGIIPLSVAARVAQSHVPGWSDEELREWVESQRGLATPEVVARLLGGGA